MTRTKALFFIILLSIGLISAQNKEVTFDHQVSKPYKVIDARHKIYYAHNGHILSFKVAKKHLHLLKVDMNTMAEKNRAEIKLPKKATLEAFKQFNGKFYLFYSIYNKSSKSEQLFCREVDFETLGWTGAEKLLVSTDGKLSEARYQLAYPATGFAKEYGIATVPKFDVYSSSDKSRFLVAYRMIPEYKNDNKSFDEIGFHVFDSELNPLWDDVVRMPYTEKKMNNLNYSIDNNGTAYILASVYDDNSTDAKKRGSDEPNYHLELLAKPINEKLNTSKIELESQFIQGGWLYETPTKEMVYAGFYNTTDDQTAEGIFVNKFDQTGSLTDQLDHSIPLEILNQYASKRAKKQNIKDDADDEAGFKNLRISDMKFLEDGSVVIIGEQYYTTTHTYSSANGSSTSTTYHYNDILISKIDANGNLAWMRKLPKRQVGKGGSGGLSYAHFYSNGNHYLFYIDNIKNKNLEPDEEPAIHIDNTFGYLTCYIVEDAIGAVEKETLFNMERANGTELHQFSPWRMLQVNVNEIAFEAYKKGKEEVIVKISIQEQ